MFRIMLQKMWQKRWMNLSLLLGCILLIATAVSFPLYQKAAYDRMLQDEFTNYMSSEGLWPLVINMQATCQKDTKGTIGKMESYTSKIYEELGVEEYQTILYYNMLKSRVSSDIKRDDATDLTLCLNSMSDLEDHIELVSGSCYSESGYDEDGAIEVIVSQYTLVNKGLLIGETLTFDTLKTAEGDPIRIKITGVFTEADKENFYFQIKPERLFDVCFVNPELYRTLFLGDNSRLYNLSVSFFDLVDYTKVTADQVGKINEGTDYLCEKSAYRSVIKAPRYKSLLEEYELKKIRISATLMILQIPVLVLLAAFLLMISGQMYELERNEISVIKSRGSSRGQILLLYVYQGLFLTVIGAVIGIPLGAFFSRMLGSTRDFLEFDMSKSLEVSYTPQALYYALAAMFITLVCISVPAVKHSKVSIVNLKQQRAIKKKSLWEILFIDFVFLGISLYGYYTFKKRLSTISETVLSGEKLDPLLYISSSLFIVGMGLFFLRIQPYIIKLIYTLFKRFCSPAGYISFMENIKNGRKMQLIMLFLIMTISLGMFHATVARTILENALENTDYLDGTDVIMKENWPMMHDSEGAPTGQYIEPDPSKFMKMDFAKGYTKVYYDDKAYIRQGKNDRQSLTIMGINTREFGQITKLPAGLLPKNYREYLNKLAAVQDGVLLSRNFQTAQGLKEGDTINYYTNDGKLLAGTVVDFVDYFPTYSPKVTIIQPDGTAVTQDNYLIVSHFSFIKKKLGIKPYEVWLSVGEDTSTDDVYDFIDDNNMKLSRYVNRSIDIENTLTDPLLQGTNGVLTMGFVVTLLLCAVGYLIYWIMSIKERELIFGVLRACGFHKGEIVRMLIYEQIFCGLFSVLAGIVTGRLSSKMFVPMLQASYATSDQVLPMKLITRASDMYRLYGIISAVMLLSIAVLIFLLFHMNVTKALKLGEE